MSRKLLFAVIVVGLVVVPSASARPTQLMPGVSYEQGMGLANQIHNSGRAIVWSGARELAEHYHEQLAGHGLTMAPLEQG